MKWHNLHARVSISLRFRACWYFQRNSNLASRERAAQVISRADVFWAHERGQELRPRRRVRARRYNVASIEAGARSKADPNRGEKGRYGLSSA